MTAVAAGTSASSISTDRVAYHYEQLRNEGLGSRRSGSVSMAHTIVVRQGVAAWLCLVVADEHGGRGSRAVTPAPSCPELLGVLTMFWRHPDGPAGSLNELHAC